MHYNVNVIIRSANFFLAGYTERNYSIFIFFLGTELYAPQIFRPSPHMLGLSGPQVGERKERGWGTYSAYKNL